MSLGYTEIDYVIRGATHEWPVRGIQVGRFAVRHATGDHPHSVSETDEDVERYPWRVDHIRSGLMVASFADHEDAYAFIDDISRFARRDVSGKTLHRVRDQIGQSLFRWSSHVADRHRYVPFREWLVERGVPWKPRGRKWRKVR